MKRLLKKTKKISRTSLRNKADKLFSLLVRSRGRCEYCGKGEPKTLQCAHIISRANLHLRYDPKNALALCYFHHLQFFHRSPLEAMSWFIAVYPKEYAYLMKEKDIIEPNIDYEKIIKRLSKINTDTFN
jgi:hypothetical protein